jgi:Rps23 Pro-64 3,4-dihydroxylase Tpa1-like proline 4-hydroxylase
MKIIENCVSQYQADEIESIFLDKFTSWWYAPTTLGHEHASVAQPVYDTFQLEHHIMENGRYDSPYTQMILNLSNKIFSDLSIHVLNYRRIKVNQLLKNNATDYKHHPPHVDDTADNMISLIYYVNDSDGPTYFFDKDRNCLNKIHPKKNQCVVFASNMLHASSSPNIFDRRLVINYVAATNSKINL